MRLLSIAIAALILATPAAAHDLRVSVTTPSGAAVRDAVVMVYPKAGVPKRPIRFSWPYLMVQKNMQFDPFVLIVPVGAEVAFPNRDNTRHHVYSFSPAKKFQLKLYGNDETRLVKFDKAGVVAIGCNIHDNMTAFIRVVDTPWAAKTGADGGVVIKDAPAGAVTVAVWHPYLKGGRDVTRQLASGSGAVKMTADLRVPAMRRHGY
ncbi:MAG TPA: methylamine utilization protein [Caulobacteraceae bacterium]|nr:methylamine utilization protein [Caulobacteraceae bacterium]